MANSPESDDELFDDLADQGWEPAKPTDPSRHFWASQLSSFNRADVKPHKCLDQLEQRGNYIHCRTGNHGMRIPNHKVLRRDPETLEWRLDDIEILQVNAKGRVVKPK